MKESDRKIIELIVVVVLMGFTAGLVFKVADIPVKIERHLIA